jgi:hypothetical protein
VQRHHTHDDRRSASKGVLGSAAMATASNDMDACSQGCRTDFGCPVLLMPLLARSASSPFQQLLSICRPPVLLATPDESREAQLTISGMVHQAICAETVRCNSFLSPELGVVGAEPEYRTWSDGRDALRLGWVQEALAQRRTVYLTDIVSRTSLQPAADWKQQADGLVAQLLGRHMTTGFLLRHCSYPTPGVHSPSYFVLFCDAAASDSDVALTSPHHNESHRCAAWHLLLRHPKPVDVRVDDSCVALPDSPAAPVSTDRSVVTATILRALAAKTDIHEGNSVLEVGMTSTSVRGRRSASSPTAKDLYRREKDA